MVEKKYVDPYIEQRESYSMSFFLQTAQIYQGVERERGGGRGRKMHAYKIYTGINQKIVKKKRVRSLKIIRAT